MGPQAMENTTKMSQPSNLALAAATAHAASASTRWEDDSDVAIESRNKAVDVIDTGNAVVEQVENRGAIRAAPMASDLSETKWWARSAWDVGSGNNRYWASWEGQGANADAWF